MEELNIKLLGADILVSTYTEDSLNDILGGPETDDMTNSISEVQKVLKAGPEVRLVKENDMIRIRILNIMRAVPNWVEKSADSADLVQDGTNLAIDPSRIIEIGDKTYLLLRESDVAYITVTEE
jgi:hypothetical protein